RLRQSADLLRGLGVTFLLEPARECVSRGGELVERQLEELFQRFYFRCRRQNTRRMPRSIWSGSITFGLVNVPVRLYSAVQEHKLRFHFVHEKDSSPIGYQKI